MKPELPYITVFPCQGNVFIELAELVSASRSNISRCSFQFPPHCSKTCIKCEAVNGRFCHQALCCIDTTAKPLFIPSVFVHTFSVCFSVNARSGLAVSKKEMLWWCVLIFTHGGLFHFSGKKNKKLNESNCKAFPRTPQWNFQCSLRKYYQRVNNTALNLGVSCCLVTTQVCAAFCFALVVSNSTRGEAIMPVPPRVSDAVVVYRSKFVFAACMWERSHVRASSLFLPSVECVYGGLVSVCLASQLSLHTNAASGCGILDDRKQIQLVPDEWHFISAWW